jgi:NADH-quinone oxidoreductase subunit J
MLALADYMFYFLALLTLGAGLGVLLLGNPLYAALSLALSMCGVALLFVSLDAWFLAGVQLIVYAGAVMVLFVMVIMLFNIPAEKQAFSRGTVSGFFKLASGGVLLGLIAGSIYMSAETVFAPPPAAQAAGEKLGDITQQLSDALFTRYVFGFEVIGALLLMIAVGAVALSRIPGGTHAND